MPDENVLFSFKNASQSDRAQSIGHSHTGVTRKKRSESGTGNRRPVSTDRVPAVAMIG